MITINGTTGIAGTNGSAGTPAVQGEDTNTGIFFPAADTVAVATAGTERLRVNSSGNAGLGVTPAAWSGTARALQVGNAGIEGRTDNASYNTLSANAYTDSGTWKYISSDWASRYTQFQGVHYWLTAPSGTAGNAITFTQAMTLDASGNLLVGTTTPAQTISTNNVLTLKGKDPANVWGVGPTSSFGNFYISTSGTGVSLAGGATSWGTVSDERQKDIIEPIADAVAKVLSLRSVIGRYKTDADGTRRSFLIAQDVQAALPEAIDVGEDEANTLSVKYTEVIPLLVAAIKELTARVAQLEAQ